MDNATDGNQGAGQPFKSMQLAISEGEVSNYLNAFPALNREAVVAAMIAHGPWREDVERQLRVMFDEYVRSPQPGLSEQRLHTVLQFIESSLHERLTVLDMAKTVNLSQFHFSRAFAHSVGQSPHMFLTLRRIERAKLLLARGVVPLAKVAAEAGFRTHSHFSGVFTKYVGMAPGKYRDTVATRNLSYRDDAGGPK